MKNKANNPMTNGAVKWGVTHNHPRGFLGKTKSLEERKRIRIRISDTAKKNCTSYKPVRAIYPDGKTEEYRGMNEAEKGVGLTRPVIRNLIKSGKPFEIKFKNGVSEKRQHLIGIRFELI